MRDGNSKTRNKPSPAIYQIRWARQLRITNPIAGRNILRGAQDDAELERHAERSIYAWRRPRPTAREMVHRYKCPTVAPRSPANGWGLLFGATPWVAARCPSPPVPCNSRDRG